MRNKELIEIENELILTVANRFQRQQMEIGHIRELLQYQEMLNLLGKEPVKQAFMNGTDGAVVRPFFVNPLLHYYFYSAMRSNDDILENAREFRYSLFSGIKRWHRSK